MHVPVKLSEVSVKKILHFFQVCDLEDILHEVSETTVVLCGAGDDMMISIPKREQTQSEVERTHQFAQVIFFETRLKIVWIISPNSVFLLL